MATDRRVTFLIGANVKNFTKGLNKAQRKFRKFGRDLERMGSTLTRAVSVPIAVMGGAAVKAAGDFESSFADIRKTVDASEPTFQMIQDQMRGLAKRIPTSVNELNRLGGVAGQLGIEAENIVEFTETLAKLADTTDVVGQEGALNLSRFMNVMGTAQGDIDRLASTIVGLGNNFAAMESEIIEAGTSLAPLGNSIGLTEQQVLAFSTTIAASGGKIRAASTAFQKTANTMKQAVIEGNENLETFAETAGMSAEEFQRAFQEDAAGALQSFLEGLRRVQKEGGSTATVLEKVGLADQRLIREFGKVLGNLDDLSRALPQANEEWERNTALTEEAQKRYSTFNSRVGVLKNNLFDLGIVVGNKLIPFVDKLIKQAQSAIDYVSGLSDETIKWWISVGKVAAVVGPLVWTTGKLVKGFAALIGGLKTAIIWGRKLITVFRGLIALQASTWVGAIATAVALLTTKIIIANSKIATFKSRIQEALNLEPTGTRKELDRVVQTISDISDRMREIQKRADEGLMPQEQADFMIKQLEKKVRDLVEIRDQIISMMQVPVTSTDEDTSGQPATKTTSGITKFATSITSTTASVVKSSKRMADEWNKSIASMMVDTHNFTSASDAAILTWVEKMEARGKQFKEIIARTIERGIEEMTVTFLAGIGKMMAGAQTVGGIFKSVLNTLANLAVRVGKIAIAIGIGVKAIKESLKSLNPIIAIAAGAALVALGSWAKSALSKSAEGEEGQQRPRGVPGMAMGGIVPEGFPNDTYPAMLTSGEMVVPEPKALPKNMGGSPEFVQTTVNIDGVKVLTAMAKAKNNLR